MEKKLLEIDNCIQCNYHYSINEDNFCCFKRNKKIKKITDGIPSWCGLPSMKYFAGKEYTIKEIIRDFKREL